MDIACLERRGVNEQGKGQSIYLKKGIQLRTHVLEFSAQNTLGAILKLLDREKI